MGQFFINFRRPFRTIGQSMIEEERERIKKNSIPQSEHLSNLVRMINACSEIKIAGYDPVLFEDVDVLYALEMAIRGEHPTQKRDYPVSVYAVFPQNTHNERIEVLANEHPGNLRILRTHERINPGFMVFYEFGVFGWDLDRLTTYQPEVEDGVIRRTSIVNHRSARNYIAVYDKIESRVLDQQFQESRVIA